MILGSTVTVTVDRPLGSVHPQYKNVQYPINYGYIDGIIAEDGAYQDCYIMGVDVPIETFTGIVIAIIIRHNDDEDKWVVANQDYSVKQIQEATYFMEQYFESTIQK